VTKIIQAQSSSIISKSELAKRVEAAQISNISSGTAVGGLFAKTLCASLVVMPVFVTATEAVKYTFNLI